MTAEPLRILVVEARFYDALADALLAGATAVLEAHGASVEVASVPGALEIPGGDRHGRARRAASTAMSPWAASFAARPTTSRSSPMNARAA